MTTELQAINIMLSVVGESPVSDHEGDVIPEVSTAKAILSEVLREVLERGWGFNTDYCYTLVRNEANKIPVPETALQIQFDRTDLSVDPVVRGEFLYDRKTQGFTFEDNVEATRIVFYLPFSQCPEPVKKYALVRAARLFAQRLLTNPQLDGFNEQAERIALARLMNYDLQSEGTTMLSSPAMYGVTMRQPR